jgi:hypothetical protein
MTVLCFPGTLLIGLNTLNDLLRMPIRTKRMVFRIMVVTVNSGTWTALVAFLVLLLVRDSTNCQ